MKIGLLSVVMFVACGLFGTAAHAQNAPAFPPLNDGTSKTVPFSQWKFHDTGARGVDGVTKIEAADAYGDMANGQHGTIFRFTSGFISPVHTHTYDYYAVVIQGETENYEVGVKPIKMGPGSYWYQRGKKAHTTAGVSKEPCLAFIVQSQKFDAQVPPEEE